MRERLFELLEPGIEALGYEVVDIEYHPRHGGGLVRIYIDGLEGVGLEDCERVSEQVSGLLDVEDPIPGAYDLEVSSPGLDRVLRTRAHFESFTGHKVKLQLKFARDGRRRFTGTLAGLDQDDLVLELDGETVRLPFDGIEKARLMPCFNESLTTGKTGR